MQLSNIAAFQRANSNSYPFGMVFESVHQKRPCGSWSNSEPYLVHLVLDQEHWVVWERSNIYSPRVGAWKKGAFGGTYFRIERRKIQIQHPGKRRRGQWESTRYLGEVGRASSVSWQEGGRGGHPCVEGWGRKLRKSREKTKDNGKHKVGELKGGRCQ